MVQPTETAPPWKRPTLWSYRLPASIEVTESRAMARYRADALVHHSLGNLNANTKVFISGHQNGIANGTVAGQLNQIGDDKRVDALLLAKTAVSLRVRSARAFFAPARAADPWANRYPASTKTATLGIGPPDIGKGPRRDPF